MRSCRSGRREQSVIRTARRRPDLLEKAELTADERKLVEEILREKETGENSEK